MWIMTKGMCLRIRGELLPFQGEDYRVFRNPGRCPGLRAIPALSGRLWQSLILGKLHPLFEHLPVENMVYRNQQQYYDAITASTNAGQSGPFIDYMLNEIYKTLKAHQGEELSINNNNPIEKEFRIKFGEEFGIKYGIKFGINEKTLLIMLNSNPSSTAADVAEKVGLSLRGVEKMIKRLKDAGVISREGSRKNGFWIIKKNI